MSERALLVDELLRAHAGDPWHGPARSTVLADISVDEAARRPGGDAHSIWELVLHMRAWTQEVTRRLAGGEPGEPAEGDWPPVPSPTADAWTTTLRGLDEAHDRLVAMLRDYRAERLDERVGRDRDPALGAGVSYRQMLHGLAQHDAYHTGQIAILKRIYRATPS